MAATTPQATAATPLLTEDVVHYDPLGQVHERRDAVRQLYQGNFDAGFIEMSIDDKTTITEVNHAERR